MIEGGGAGEGRVGVGELGRRGAVGEAGSRLARRRLLPHLTGHGGTGEGHLIH